MIFFLIELAMPDEAVIAGMYAYITIYTKGVGILMKSKEANI